MDELQTVSFIGTVHRFFIVESKPCRDKSSSTTAPAPKLMLNIGKLKINTNLNFIRLIDNIVNRLDSEEKKCFTTSYS
jgi:hypothetical protein